MKNAFINTFWINKSIFREQIKSLTVFKFVLDSCSENKHVILYRFV